MSNQNQGASIEAVLLPCPMCGCADVQFDSPGGPDESSFDFVICNGCGVSAGRADCEGDLCEIWNRRTPAAPAGAGELPPLLSPMNVEAVVEIMDKYEFQDPETANTCFDRLGFAQEVARAAIEADRAQRAGAAAPSVKTWEQRLVAKFGTIPRGGHLDRESAMQSEIADLRAQLASKDATLDFLSKFGKPRELTDAAPASAQPADPTNAQAGLIITQHELGAVLNAAMHLDATHELPVTAAALYQLAKRVDAQPDQRDIVAEGQPRAKGGDVDAGGRDE